jgi:hypothetical protein
MLDPNSIKNLVINGFQGLVSALGDASPPTTLVGRPDGQGVIALVRDGYQVKTLEGQRVNARVHVFEEVASLADWLKRHADPKVVEVLVGEQRVVAALTPRDIHGDQVVCPLHLHPRWARWQKLLDQPVGQRLLHRFVLSSLEDFEVLPVEGSAVGISAGETLASQLAKFEALKTSEVKVELDERGFVRFAGMSEKTEVSGKLPPRFKVRVPLFLGVEQLVDGKPAGEAFYELEIHLRVIVETGRPPAFELSCPNLEVVVRGARIDAVAWLRHLLGEGFLVGLGDLKLNSVPVVK